MAEIRLDRVAFGREAPSGRRAARAPAPLETLSARWSDGGAHAVLGPAGAGKTALLSVVLGFARPLAGGVWLDDVEVTAIRPAERRLASVEPEPVVYPTMSVRDQIAFPLRNAGVRRAEAGERIEAMAKLFELGELLNQPGGALSPSDRQRVALARAFVRPGLAAIVLDEPLAPFSRAEARAMIPRLRAAWAQSGATALLATRDPDCALSFAQGVSVMREGRIVQTGTPAELLDRPEHRFVGELVGSAPMNFLPCSNLMGEVTIDGIGFALGEAAARRVEGKRGKIEVGARPESLVLAPPDDPDGLEVVILRARERGARRLVDVRLGEHRVVVSEPADAPAREDAAKLVFDPGRTLLYVGGELVGGVG